MPELKKTYVHFTGTGIVYCNCNNVCVGGQIQEYSLLKNEINIVRENCFSIKACEHVVFDVVQLEEIYNCQSTVL